MKMTSEEKINQILKLRSDKIKVLLESSQMPRNQIAGISGLSNTYIRDLELGNIVNVSRGKTLALSIAFNLTLEKIDELLNIFDQAFLSPNDIPIIVDISKKVKFSSAMIPLRDRFRLDLMMLSAERIPGDLHIISSRPTHSLRAKGHASYSERHALGNHPIAADLLEAINLERNHFLMQNLKHARVIQYICRDCLETYVLECTDPMEKQWRKQHVENLIQCLENCENARVHITRDCPTFMIVLKKGQTDKTRTDRLLMTYIPPHGSVPNDSGTGRFVGFATTNANVINNINNDFATTRAAGAPGLEDRDSVIGYLKQLVRR